MSSSLSSQSVIISGRPSCFLFQFLICSLCFATFSVDKNRPHNRLQLSFTLMLTAVAFKSVVNQSLPKISYLTYMVRTNYSPSFVIIYSFGFLLFFLMNAVLLAGLNYATIKYRHIEKQTNVPLQ